LAERKNYPLRLDPNVYEALRRWADDEMRSVNAQIEFLLSRALRQAGRVPRTSPPTAGGKGKDED
jgi:hypothetical protein